MLQKVAIHQTRLRVPGVGLDARGVCLGAKGLILLPSIDRAVAFLAIYTREVSLTHVLDDSSIQLVRSKLGAREVALIFQAPTSDMLDRLADIGRLTGGFTFTGTSRHFVQFRDRAAPFGYDAAELLAQSADLCLYHSSFSQAYDLEREVDFRHLVLTLEPSTDPRPTEPERAWVLAKPALGPALCRHFVSAGLAAQVCCIEAATSVGLERQLAPEWLFRLSALPQRAFGLLTRTPGLDLFVERAPGALVQYGFEHPFELSACPVFQQGELVLFHGARPKWRPPRLVDQVPVMADVRTLVEPYVADLDAVPTTLAANQPTRLPVRVRLVPSATASRHVGAARLVGPGQGYLRKLAYLFGPETIRSTRIAATDHGVFVLVSSAPEGALLGELYADLTERCFIPLGCDLAPRMDASRLLEAMGVPSDQLVFFQRDGACHALDAGSFVPLEQALLDPYPWTELEVREISPALDLELPTLWLEPLGFRPLRRKRHRESKNGS
jgi:hypothetical protein